MSAENDHPAGLAKHLRPIWDEMKDIVHEGIPAPALEALCGQVHLMRTAESRVHEEGPVVTDGKGNPVPHPAINIAKDAGSEVRRWTDKYPRRSY